MRRQLSTCISSSRNYDVVIVGGGVVGSSIAYHLAKLAPRRILVIERDNTYRLASLSLSAGGIRQQFSLPENIKMCIYGAEFVKAAKTELVVSGQEVPDLSFKENGYLFLAGDKASKDTLKANHKVQLECGAVWMKLLDPVVLKKEFPWLNIDGLELGSFSLRNEGYFDPWSFVNAMKQKAISLGVEYIEAEVIGAAMTRAMNSPLSVDYLRVASCARGNKVHSEGILHIKGEKFVNAAGAWAGKFVDMLIAHSPTSSSSAHTAITRLPVERRKRCIFTVHCPGAVSSPVGEDPLCPPPNTPLVIDPSGVYFRPEGGRLLSSFSTHKLSYPPPAFDVHTGPGKFIVGVSPTEERDAPCTSDSELENVDEYLFDDVIWPTLSERVPAFEQLKGVIGCL